MADRSTWRGRRVAPRNPRQAWSAFAREVLVVLAGGAGVAAIALIVASGAVELRFRVWWDYVLVRIAVAALVPLVLGYEIWLLWSRLAAFRKGEVFVDDDEVSPDAVPAASTRKRRETPAQARRRTAFWREMVLVTVVWLFCAGGAALVTVLDVQAGRPFLGEAGMGLLGLVALYAGYLVLAITLRRDKDRGL